MAELSLSDSNWGVLALGQALLGKISPNFRMVGLHFADSTWTIRATLWRDDSADREAIADTREYFWTGLDDMRRSDRLSVAWTDVVADVVVSDGPLDLPNGHTDNRLVFLMSRRK